MKLKPKFKKAMKAYEYPSPDAGLPPKDTIDSMLSERNETHGDAWFLAGKVIAELHDSDHLENLLSTPLSHNWVQILSKLFRILTTPENIDHWRDIEGYARLVREYLESKNARNTTQAPTHDID